MVKKVARNIIEYIDIINKIKIEEENNNNYSDLIFRGQSSEKDPLPKLARLKPKATLLKIEELIITEFRRNYSSKLGIIPTSEWEWLALAQHHGLPTRLLDWSYSSLIALWFAVKDELSLIKKCNDLFSGHVSVYVLAATLEKWKEIEKFPDPFQINTTVIFRPQAVTERIKVQSSVFTAHPLCNGINTINLWDNDRVSAKLIRISIPCENIFQVRKELKTMGINNFTVFPDLDGLCKHLECLYFDYKDEIEYEKRKRT